MRTLQAAPKVSTIEKFHIALQRTHPFNIPVGGEVTFQLRANSCEGFSLNYKSFNEKPSLIHVDGIELVKVVLLYTSLSTCSWDHNIM